MIRYATLAAALALAGGTALAQEAVTPQALVDRAEISDLITRYYQNLGHAGGASMASYYTDDAELVLGGKSYKGHEGIESAYGGPARNAGQNGAPSPAARGGGGPQPGAYSFNVLLSNPLIVVHGDTATARLIFTEVVMDTRTAPPRLLTQGREFDNLVKVGGRWRIQKRQIVGAADEPADWKE